MSSQIARMVVSSFRQPGQSPLTSREQESLNLLSQGKSYLQISEGLFVHRENVKSHIKNIYEKLHVNNKKEVLEVARKNRFLL
jgi:DNA-binding CsgD family transcriptional regulator